MFRNKLSGASAWYFPTELWQGKHYLPPWEQRLASKKGGVSAVIAKATEDWFSLMPVTSPDSASILPRGKGKKRTQSLRLRKLEETGGEPNWNHNCTADFWCMLGKWGVLLEAEISNGFLWRLFRDPNFCEAFLLALWYYNVELIVLLPWRNWHA